MTHETVSIDLGSRGYNIQIGAGLMAQSGQLIAPLLKRPKVVIITDSNVAPHFLRPVAQSLNNVGIETNEIVLSPGEGTKSFEILEKLCNELIELRVERSDTLIALGGGVIGDLTGFAASILRRGCDFIQIPTTLLAQVDSSVGGKTAINASGGKNLIGSFYQPRLVVADIQALESLPEREFLAGYAEVAKYGLLGDAGFFGWLEQNGTELIKSGADQLTYAVKVSVETKAKIVAEDEKEHGRRALLNLGHTFGHALEAVSGYSGRLLHGEAVAIGMVLAFEFSERTGLCNSDDTARVVAHLESIGLPTRTQHIDGFNASADTLMSLIAQDKKVSDGKLTFILARGIGDAFVANDVAAESVKDYLTSIL